MLSKVSYCLRSDILAQVPLYKHPTIQAMIAYITGTVREIRQSSVIILVTGLGYEVHTPTSVLAKLKVGQHTELHTRFVVREDAQLLFGFADSDSVQVFDLLTAVSGIGPKLGLALIAAMPLPALCSGIRAGDVKLLSSVSGVGKKTAERLILELASKIPEHLSVAATSAHATTQNTDPAAAQDAIEALLALGFREGQVRSVVTNLLALDPEQSADSLIRKGLGQLR